MVVVASHDHRHGDVTTEHTHLKKVHLRFQFFNSKQANVATPYRRRLLIELTMLVFVYWNMCNFILDETRQLLNDCPRCKQTVSRSVTPWGRRSSLSSFLITDDQSADSFELILGQTIYSHRWPFDNVNFVWEKNSVVQLSKSNCVWQWFSTLHMLSTTETGPFCSLYSNLKFFSSPTWKAKEVAGMMAQVFFQTPSEAKAVSVHTFPFVFLLTSYPMLPLNWLFRTLSKRITEKFSSCNNGSSSSL